MVDEGKKSVYGNGDEICLTDLTSGRYCRGPEADLHLDPEQEFHIPHQDYGYYVQNNV